MPYVPYHRSRKHAAISLYKKRLRMGLMLVLFVIAATYALNFFFDIGRYMPNVHEPKDLEREKLIKKLDDKAQPKH